MRVGESRVEPLRRCLHGTHTRLTGKHTIVFGHHAAGGANMKENNRQKGRALSPQEKKQMHSFSFFVFGWGSKQGFLLLFTNRSM